ncbi:MAG: hypothetical protein ACTSWN_16720, partial [Promethearchaeota archaeon]
MLSQKKLFLGMFVTVSIVMGFLLFLEPLVNDINDSSSGNTDFREPLTLQDVGGKSPPSQSGIDANNHYVGTGDALTIYEHGATNVTSQNLEISSTSPGTSVISVPSGWEATELDTYVYNLFETADRTSNGNFATGSNSGSWNTYSLGDGQYGTYSQTGTQSYPTDWVDFCFNPAGGTYAGTYSMETGWRSTDSSIRTYIHGLFANSFLNYNLRYDDDLEAKWNQTVAFPRSNPDFAEVQFSIYVVSGCLYQTNVEIEVNGNLVFTRSALGFPVDQWFDVTAQFNPAVISGNQITISIGLRTDPVEVHRVWPAWGDGDPEAHQEVFFSNVKLIVRAEADPTDVNLQMSLDQDPDGRGTISIPASGLDTYISTNHWDNSGGTSNLPVTATFTTSLPEVGGYKSVKFTLNQNFTGLSTRNSLVSLTNRVPGVSFDSQGGSNTDWSFVFFAKPPTMETPQSNIYNYFINMTIPTDWAVSYIEDPTGIDRTTDITGGGLGDG